MTNDPSAPSGLSLAAIAVLLKGQTIEAIKVVRPRAEPRSERSQGCRRGLSEDSTGPEEKNDNGASGVEAGLRPVACYGFDSSSPRCLLVLDTRGISRKK
jgi:hypothetical protein